MSDMRSTYPQIYGLGGSKGAGKDTVAKLFQELNPRLDVRIIGMSDPLREAIWTMNPLFTIPKRDNEGIKSIGFWTYQDFYKEMESGFPKEDPYTVVKRYEPIRNWLQTFGTDVGRNILGEDTWVNVAEDRINDAIEDGVDVIFLTGIRFRNELELIWNYDGESIYVNRGQEVEDSHCSENSLTSEDFEITIENNEGILQLRTKVRAALWQGE